MQKFIFANNIKTTVGLAFPSGSTTLTLASSVGLPTLSAGQVLPITLNDAADGLIYEICYITAITGVTCTVIRAQEGTTAQNWSIGDFAFCAPTAGSVAPQFGNPNNVFKVANPASDDDAVNRLQMRNNLTAIGYFTNLNAQLMIAGNSITFTADEIVTGSSLGGQAYRISNVSKSINVSTVGAGGMDSGSAPVSGYVAIYAIYNPTTNIVALLGTDATSSIQNTIYSGSSMPSGYTSSSLISVWATDSSSNLIVGMQRGRKVSIINSTALSSSTPQTSYALLSLENNVPLNAIRISGSSNIQNLSASTNTSAAINIASDPNEIGLQFNQSSLSPGQLVQNYVIDLLTPQHIYYRAVTIPSVSANYAIYISAYEF